MNKRVLPVDIKFAEGKAVLKQGPHNAPELQKIARELKRYPVIHIEIEGNPDAEKTAAANRALSLQRAEALRDALTDLYHLPPSRIQLHAAGETDAAKIATAAPSLNHPMYVILYDLEDSAERRVP